MVHCNGDPGDVEATLSKYNTELNPDGSYSYQYASSNSLDIAESGVGSSYASGTYAYTSPEGQPIKLSYIADENGYQPNGDHLPTPPPIPDYILKSIDYIQSHPFVKVSLNSE